MRRFLAAVLCSALVAMPIAAAGTAYAEPGPGQSEACSSGATCVNLYPSLIGTEIGVGQPIQVSLTIVVSGGDLTSGTVSTQLDPVLTADASTVDVADPGAVQQSENNVVIDLVAAGFSTAGLYDVSFVVSLSPDADVEVGETYSSWARMDVETVDEPGVTQTATSGDSVVTIVAPRANVRLFAPSDAATPISKSGLEFVDISVYGDDNFASELTFSLPAGLELSGEGVNGNQGSPLTCQVSAPSSYTCAVPAGFSEGVAVHLTALPSLAIGTQTSVTFTITPVHADDADVEDNSVTTLIRVNGLANFVQAISPQSVGDESLPIPVGTPTTFTVTVTNPGADPAVGVRIRTFLFDPTVGIAQISDPFANDDLTVTGLGIHVFSSIPVGGSVQYPVTVTALKPGSSWVIGTNGTSDSARAGLQCVDLSCFAAARSRITLVAAAGPSSPGPGATGPGATGPGATGPGATGPGASGPGAAGPAIADTGVEVGTVRTTGIMLLALGLALSWAGRRRTTSESSYV